MALTLGVLVLGPLALGAVRPSEFVILQFLTVGILALWLVRYWFGKTHRLLWTPICWPVAAFVVFAVVRYFTADLEWVARQELIRILIYAALFFAVLNNLHRQESTRIIALTLVGLGTVIAFYAAVQYLTNTNRVWHFTRPPDYAGRASGTYICPNHFAGFLGLLMPLALSFAVTGRFKAVPRVMLAYGALVMMAGLVVSVSRGAWVASAAGLLVFLSCILRQRSSRIFGIAIILIVVLGGTLAYFKSWRLRERLSATRLAGTDPNLRLRIWPATIRMWKDHVWTGVGPGHFDFRYREYRDMHDQLQGRPERAHNDYLNTLADWGVIGFALVGASWALLYYGVFRGWRFIRRRGNDLAQKRSNKSAFVLGASIGLLTVLVHSVVDFNMHIPANAILVVTLMALVTAHLRFASDRYWVTQHRTGQVLGTLFIGAALIYLAAEGWRTAREHSFLRRAEALSDDPAAKQALLEKAFAVNPKNAETAYALGENLRRRSWLGEPGYEQLATTAMDWFKRAVELNPYDGYGYMRIGMCLDWLGRHGESGEWFERGVKLDPNGYYMLAHVGWHYFQVEDYAKAREWFTQSLRRFWTDNPIARTYLKLIDEREAEQKRKKP
ncbi:MAG: O-antigen ligase family protein [Verrucomicrobia bacterium]|nr:O-antigen ligase family protein [Verrucomicrobiota bacterium]